MNFKRNHWKKKNPGEINKRFTERNPERISCWNHERNRIGNQAGINERIHSSRYLMGFQKAFMEEWSTDFLKNSCRNLSRNPENINEEILERILKESQEKAGRNSSKIFKKNHWRNSSRNRGIFVGSLVPENKAGESI